MTSPHWDLLTMTDFTSSTQPHTLAQTLGTEQRETLGSSQLTLPSTSPALLSGHRILWENPAARPPPQPPSTTPTAPRKVPYKGVGNIAWVLHHHNKKRKRKQPVQIQNLDRFSSFSSVCLNALTDQPACGIWRIFSLKKKEKKRQFWGENPFYGCK